MDENLLAERFEECMYGDSDIRNLYENKKKLPAGK